MTMLRVYGHYKYIIGFSAEIVFRRQNLTSVDVRLWRLKTVPVLKGLILGWWLFCQGEWKNYMKSMKLEGKDGILTL